MNEITSGSGAKDNEAAAKMTSDGGDQQVDPTINLPFICNFLSSAKSGEVREELVYCVSFPRWYDEGLDLRYTSFWLVYFITPGSRYSINRL